MAEAHTHHHDHAHEEAKGIRTTAQFILTGLSGGHAVFHWFSQSFFVMLPEVCLLYTSPSPRDRG